jgi:PAS domain-containing protein
MRLRVETAIGIGSVLMLQLVGAFSAIGLLGRTGPVVDRLLVENVVSLDAVEQMLESLADTSSVPEQFEAALNVAAGNITESHEPRAIARISASWREAMDGDAVAVAETVDALDDLWEVNRVSMDEVGSAARWLAQAGQWAQALLGGVGFAISVLVFRRLRSRLEEPIEELDLTLQAARTGDPRRRSVILTGPVETRRISENVNWMLDCLEERSRPTMLNASSRDRALLIALLDRESAPVFVVGDEGRILSSNQAALPVVGTTVRPAELVAALTAHEPLPPGWASERVEAAQAWICRAVPDALAS